MKFAAFLAAVTLAVAPLAAAKKKSVRKRVPAAATSPAIRAAALTEIKARIESAQTAFENPAGLVTFFEQLYRMTPDKDGIHVLHYGDSHTASDDWADALRKSFQGKFGSGGPGFSFAGHPYRGYRRFDVTSANSPSWETAGTVGHLDDGRLGLGGVSMTTNRAGQTVLMSAAGEELELFYLQQPGGGAMELTVDDRAAGAIPTNGELGPGYYKFTASSGPHICVLKTLDAAPVRLFGWVAQNRGGVTWETLGINGAQATHLLDWNESILAGNLTERNPALLVLAYGTNEALKRDWNAEVYRDGFRRLIQRFRNAAPAASILVVGPPDFRFGARGSGHLDEVVEIQRAVAAENGCAFWNWRAVMGGPGSVNRWVQAGLSQNDHVHLTPSGYRLLGNTMFQDMMQLYQMFVSTRTE
ncbi:MAG: SGNH/GDSL hydrolase family protein [Acidobacteriota bacterium]|nr:SGNH/GDSL hydrolase family protein [Acidobacteriota bacterium]